MHDAGTEAGRYRLPAVHLRQHRPAQGRDGEPREPAGQPARHGDLAPGGAPGCIRQLVAHVPRHGADRRLAGQSVLRLQPGADVAVGLPGQAGTLVVGDPPLSRHPVGGAQLCLRTVPGQDQGRRARRAGPRQLAPGPQWGRTGQPGHPAALHRTFRPLWPGARRAGTGLWPGRGHPGRSLPAPGARAAGRPGAARGLPGPGPGSSRRGRRRRHPGLRLLRPALAGPPVAHSRWQWHRAARTPGGAPAIQRAVHQRRLLPRPGGDPPGAARWLDGLPRPGLHGRWRALPHRPVQGPDHPRRPQYLPLRRRSGGRQPRGPAQGMHRGIRQPGPGHRHRPPGGDGGKCREGRGGAAGSAPGHQSSGGRPCRCAA
ncbi:hypothetical protein FQZ97_705640 [compost metagenome]